MSVDELERGSLANKSKKCEMIRNKIYEYANDSTTHSVPHIFKRENPLIKTFWIICFLASTAACSFMITLSIMNYFRYETVTKAETVFEIPTPFPVVSICNVNSLTSRKAFDFVHDFLTRNNISSNLNYTFSVAKADMSTFLEGRYAIGVNLLSAKFTDDIRKEMGLQLNDMLLSCTFNMQKCTIENFVWFFDVLYGYCLI